MIYNPPIGIMPFGEGLPSCLLILDSGKHQE